MPDIGEGGTDNLDCWYSLTSSCVSVCSCFIALGASESRNNFIIVPTNRPPLADESTPSMAYFAFDACQSTSIAVSATRDLTAPRAAGRSVFFICNDRSSGRPGGRNY
eukprot:1620252-Pleurochrysis_carterae.AAC.1